ncbi:MAG: hypothetical protein H7A01_01355 [Hahellaceae bacterium]|jgi:hypothetical protein|nr:hypothetical protein [Hahellaceae bacterium]
MTTPKTDELNEEEVRAMINHFLVSKLGGLSIMYRQAIAEAKQEREWQNYLDWREWHDLDEESKQFVRDYLKDK